MLIMLLSFCAFVIAAIVIKVKNPQSKKTKKDLLWNNKTKGGFCYGKEI